MLLFMAAIWPRNAPTTDWESYCAGWCRARYQDGIYKNSKCACIDYYPINLSNRIEPLHSAPKNGFGEVQYGVDDMHYPKSDD